MWLLVSVIYGKPYIYIVACEQIKSLMSDMFIHPGFVSDPWFVWTHISWINMTDNLMEDMHGFR